MDGMIQLLRKLLKSDKKKTEDRGLFPILFFPFPLLQIQANKDGEEKGKKKKEKRRYKDENGIILGQWD
jgi:hypothetical protein